MDILNIVHTDLFSFKSHNLMSWLNQLFIRESPSQFENRIMPRGYVRRMTRSTMYQKAPFCSPEMAQ